MALCKMGVNYFKHEKKAGTPFTFEGSKELFRLGIMTIVLPLVGSMVASIVSEIINNLGKGNFNFDIDAHSSVGFGLALMAVSLVCKYGAEISSDNEYDGESYYDDDDDEDEAL